MTREEILYAYLVDKQYISKEQLLHEMRMFYPREEETCEEVNSTALRNLRKDIHAINRGDFEKIVITTKSGGKITGYAIADREEGLKLEQQLLIKALKSFDMYHRIKKKIANNGQVRIASDEEFAEVRSYIERL